MPKSVITLAAEITAGTGHPYGVGTGVRRTVLCPRSDLLDLQPERYLVYLGMDTDLAKGHLDLLLLGVLGRGPRHGYAVIAEVRERTEGAFDLSEGTVYPALHRLQDNGLLASEWQDVGGRRRRLYRLTEQGKRALSAETARWRSLTTSVEAVLRVRPAGPTPWGTTSPRRRWDFAGWQA